jgi:hypothetical protein
MDIQALRVNPNTVVGAGLIEFLLPRSASLSGLTPIAFDREDGRIMWEDIALGGTGRRVSTYLPIKLRCQMKSHLKHLSSTIPLRD